MVRRLGAVPTRISRGIPLALRPLHPELDLRLRELEMDEDLRAGHLVHTCLRPNGLDEVLERLVHLHGEAHVGSAQLEIVEAGAQRFDCLGGQKQRWGPA